MQKVNKFMKMTVAILLSLTLVTSCLLSGIFAKYITAEDTFASIGVKAFGVTITAKVSDEIKAIVDPNPNEGSVTVTVPQINMKPGDDFFDAIHFTISGKSDVRVRLRVTIAVTTAYTAANFTVPVGVGGLEESTDFMPIGFTFRALNTLGVEETQYLAEPWRRVNADDSKNDYDELETMVINNLANMVGYSSKQPTYLYRTISTIGANIGFLPKKDGTTNSKYLIDDFYFGFEWPLEHGNSLEEVESYDEISTYMANNIEQAFGVTYTVTVYQY